VEERAVVSRQDRCRTEGSKLVKCSVCGKLGQPGSRCFVKEKRETQVNPAVTNSTGGAGNITYITCFRCGGKGTYTRVRTLIVATLL